MRTNDASRCLNGLSHSDIVNELQLLIQMENFGKEEARYLQKLYSFQRNKAWILSHGAGAEFEPLQSVLSLAY